MEFIQIPPEPSELRALLITANPRGVILSMSRSADAEVVASLKIPAVGIGVRIPHIPSFSTTYSDLLVLAFQKAMEVGHSRITVPLWKKGPDIYDRMAAEMEKRMSGEPISFSVRYNLPFIQSTSAEGYHVALHELFRYTPPTCIICSEFPDYLMTISFLQARKLRVPDDISIILLAQDEHLEFIVPSIAHFSLYTDDTIHPVFQSLKKQMSGLLSHEQTVLLPAWEPGDSLRAPKSR